MKKSIFISVFAIFLLLFSTSSASAKVMWGKTELKQGQIGKITILKPINLWERDSNNKLSFERVLKPGEEYRVYRYDNLHGGQYGLGGGMYITKMPTHIKYETPSKAKLALLEKETEQSNDIISKLIGTWLNVPYEKAVIKISEKNGNLIIESETINPAEIEVQKITGNSIEGVVIGDTYVNAIDPGTKVNFILQEDNRLYMALGIEPLDFIKVDE